MKALLPIPLSFGNGEGPDVVEGMSFGPEIIKMYISIQIYSILFRIYYSFFNAYSKLPIVIFEGARVDLSHGHSPLHSSLISKPGFLQFSNSISHDSE